MKQDNTIEVYGLGDLTNRVPELIFKEVKDKHNPDKWKWTPHDPEKIRNMRKVIEEEKSLVNYSVVTNYKPSDKKQKVILLFSMGNLSYGFLKYLEEKKIKYFYFNYINFMAIGKVSIDLSEDSPEYMLDIGNTRLKFSDISAVLWNPPLYPNPMMDFNIIPQKSDNIRHRYLHQKRWTMLLKEWKAFLPKETLWIPGDYYTGSQHWQQKLAEYKLAQELGLEIPPIIFTNNRADLDRFIQRNNIDHLLLREISVPPFSFPPVRVTPAQIDARLLNAAPTCFQKYVAKKHEYRVVIVFDKVIACKIHSQNSALTREDWRVHDDANIKWEIDTLPDSLQKKLLQLARKLNLNWCSVDLIYGTDDIYYFLEMNRPGSHYWLQPFVGLDVTREIVDELIRKRRTEKL